MNKAKMNPNSLARLAAFLYLLMLPLGIFGILYVPATLVVDGDIASTVNNIMENQQLFRGSITAALLVQLNQIFLVLALYKLLKVTNKNQAALMAILILVAIPIAMLNEANRLAILFLVSGAEASTEQLYSLVSLFFNLHTSGIVIAQIFWGLWLFPMGYLVFKSGYIPKIIGILLIIGCFGYLLDSFVFILLPDVEMTFSEFTFIGELLLPLWLLIKGVNLDGWEKQVAESA